MDAIHVALERVWQAIDRRLDDPPDPLWRMYVATAVGEIAANIIVHAYRDATDATAELAVRISADGLAIIFRDRGAPFTGSLDVAPSPDDLDEHGRGIALARAAVDSLTYERTPAGENVWTLKKRFAHDLTR